MKNDLTEGSVLKKLIAFVLPIFGANLLQAMYGTVDLIVVGYFSDKAAVSAVATGSMAMQTINGIITGLSMGSMVHLGHLIGKKDFQRATHAVASAFMIFLILGAFLMGAVPLTAPLLAKCMNAPTEAVSQTISYIRICGVGIIAIIFFNGISSMFRGVGDSKSPFILMLISCLVNIGGDLLLVGVYDMGTAGAAIATVFAQLVSVLASVLIIVKRGFGFKLQRVSLRPTREDSRKILKYGLPIAAQEALTGLSFAVIMAILNDFGLVASAGVGIAEKIVGLIFIVPGAIMAAVSAFTAQNKGAGKIDRAKKSMYIGMIISLAVGVVMFYLSFFHGDLLSSFFTKDHDVIEAAADFLRSYAIDCALVSFNFNMMGYLNGCGQTLFVSIQGIVSTFLVRIPFSYFMSKVPDVSLFQVGLATPCATIFAIVLTGIYLINYNRKQKMIHLENP